MLTRIIEDKVLHAPGYPEAEHQQVMAKHEEYMARTGQQPAKGKAKGSTGEEPTRGRQVVRASGKTSGARSRSRKPVTEGMCNYPCAGDQLLNDTQMPWMKTATPVPAVSPSKCQRGALADPVARRAQHHKVSICVGFHA
jgi:hypothetical protein